MGGQSWLSGGAGRSGVTSSEFGRSGVVVSVGLPFAGDVARRFAAVEKLMSGRDDPVDRGV